MKQFNVHDVTHKLGRLLSLQTGKSIMAVVDEALEMYERSLKESGEEDELVDRLLNEAAAAIAERLCIVVPEVLREEVPRVVESTVRELHRLQEEMRQQQAKELEQVLRESTPEAPEDDLEEVTYEEIYGPDASDTSEEQE